jgi:Na+-transporting methylmalonyl-CoA/oxaloacetate decarboxylase gamma subunit
VRENYGKKILDDFGKLWYKGSEFKHYFIANGKRRLGYMRHNKNILFFLVLLAAACFIVGRAEAQQAQPPAPAKPAFKPGEEPKIKFTEVSHDFGKVEQNASLKYSYVFKNEGKSTLIIENVKAS